MQKKMGVVIGISSRSNQEKWGSYHETHGDLCSKKMVIEPTQNCWCHGINIMGIQRNQGVIEGTRSQSDRMTTWQWKCAVDSSLLNGTPMDLGDWKHNSLAKRWRLFFTNRSFLKSYLRICGKFQGFYGTHMNPHPSHIFPHHFQRLQMSSPKAVL